MMDIWSTLERYFESQRIADKYLSQADIVLALLRINTAETLAAAEELVGKPIFKCPPAVPCWPPKPPPRSTVRTVALVRMRPSVGVNGKKLPVVTKATHILSKVKRGMTKEQILSMGAYPRDIYRWTRSGYLEWKR